MVLFVDAVFDTQCMIYLGFIFILNLYKYTKFVKFHIIEQR